MGISLRRLLPLSIARTLVPLRATPKLRRAASLNIVDYVQYSQKDTRVVDVSTLYSSISAPSMQLRELCLPFSGQL